MQITLAPENPALAYFQVRRRSSADEIIRGYARFVLETACAYQLPVPLDHIRSRFHLLVHRQPLSLSGGQRGLTTDSLEILLNADDLPTVQNFTFGHELVELLFIALRDGAADDWMDDALFTALLDNKEALC